MSDRPTAEPAAWEAGLTEHPVASAAAAVSIADLTKTYRSGWWRRRTIRALRGVSLQARQGEVFGLLGPNGAGKTTLIKILLGVIRSSGGQARLLGQPAGSLAARRRVGYLPESLRIDRHHTAWSALKFYGGTSGLSASQIAQRAPRLLQLVGLADRANEAVRRFSKGMYQRLGLAQALLHEPDLLILDEPTDGLDPVGRNEVRRLILQMRDQGKTIFLNSHILQEVELICDRVAIMAAGQVRGCGTINELTRTHGLRQVRWQLTGCDDPQTLQRLLLPPSHSTSNPTSHSPGTSTAEATSGHLAASPSLGWQRLADAVWQVTVPFVDQADIDRAIDALRRQRIGIAGLTVSSGSLEQVFLRLVGDSEAAASRPQLPPQPASVAETASVADVLQESAE